MVFGPVDCTAELGGRENDGEGPSWSGLLEDLSNEASANNLVSIGDPFDLIFRKRAGVTFYNGDGFPDQVEREVHIGHDGSWSLYQKQTIQGNRIHMPTLWVLVTAVRSIEEFNDAKADGTGAVTIGGQMVDKVTYKNFINTVERVQLIEDSISAQTTAVYDAELLERVLAIDTER